MKLETERTEDSTALCHEDLELVVGLVRAALAVQSLTLSALLRKSERLASTAEVKAAVDVLARRGELALRPLADRPRSTMQTAASFDLHLQRAHGGSQDGLWSTLDTVIYQAVSRERKRGLLPHLADWLDSLPSDPCRLTQLTTAFGLFTPQEVRASVVRLAESRCLRLEFVPGDVLLAKMDATDRRPLPPAVQVSGPAVPDPELAAQIAREAAGSLASRALATLKGKGRKAA